MEEEFGLVVDEAFGEVLVADGEGQMVDAGGQMSGPPAFSRGELAGVDELALGIVGGEGDRAPRLRELHSDLVGGRVGVQQELV